MSIGQGPAFNLRLSNFEGPFDLLLQLISRHRMDITEVALSTVTDEFIAHIRAATAESGPGRWDLDQTSQFIVVAATLLHDDLAVHLDPTLIDHDLGVATGGDSGRGEHLLQADALDLFGGAFDFVTHRCPRYQGSPTGQPHRERVAPQA